VFHAIQYLLGNHERNQIPVADILFKGIILMISFSVPIRM